MDLMGRGLLKSIGLVRLGILARMSLPLSGKIQACLLKILDYAFSSEC
jgi:hypothetical protein